MNDLTAFQEILLHPDDHEPELSVLVAEFAGWTSYPSTMPGWVSVVSPTQSTNAVKVLEGYVVNPIREAIEQYVIPRYAEDIGPMMELLLHDSIKHSFEWSILSKPDTFEATLMPFKSKHPTITSPIFYWWEDKHLTHALAAVYCLFMRDFYKKRQHRVR
jgi:hypothetical protein